MICAQNRIVAIRLQQSMQEHGIEDAESAQLCFVCCSFHVPLCNCLTVRFTFITQKMKFCALCLLLFTIIFAFPLSLGNCCLEQSLCSVMKFSMRLSK